ncbi:MAG: flagellin lysine-N-methylase [Pseudomonadota bacterium]|nr:MAG: flagellin lysine-N-methylase [Pseudomonadota bacterium]
MPAIYTLRALEQFTCTGAECPLSCCTRGWSIQVDAATLAKWRSLPEPDVRERLLDSAISTHDKGKQFFVLKHAGDGRCVHLTEAGLCGVQARFGHESIPATCQEYPRATFQPESLQLKTAFLSCPELVRLVLQDSGHDPFVVAEDGLSDADRSERARLGDSVNAIVNRLLSMREAALNLRVYALATVVAELDAYLGRAGGNLSGAVTLIEKAFEGAGARVSRLQQLQRKGKYKHNKALAGCFWRLTYAIAHRGPGSDLVPEIPGLSALCAGAVESDADERQRDIKVYRTVVRQYQAVSAQTRTALDTLLEQYLRVKFVNHGFPYALHQDDHVATFLDCVVPYVLLQVLLGWQAVEQGGDGLADVALTIAKVETVLGIHNAKVFPQIEKHPELRPLEQSLGSLVELC